MMILNKAEDKLKPSARSRFGKAKAFIYCRIPNKNPTAIEAQKAVCSDYCRREGLAIAKLFQDVGTAASTVGPGLRGLIRACRAASCDVQHLVLYPTTDARWVSSVLADALKKPEVHR